MNPTKGLAAIKQDKTKVMIMLEIALSTLCGESGRNIYESIVENGSMTNEQYDWFLDNVQYNGKESILNWKGIVDYYYLTY